MTTPAAAADLADMRSRRLWTCGGRRTKNFTGGGMLEALLEVRSLELGRLCRASILLQPLMMPPWSPWSPLPLLPQVPAGLRLICPIGSCRRLPMMSSSSSAVRHMLCLRKLSWYARVWGSVMPADGGAVLMTCWQHTTAGREQLPASVGGLSQTALQSRFSITICLVDGSCPPCVSKEPWGGERWAALQAAAAGSTGSRIPDARKGLLCHDMNYNRMCARHAPYAVQSTIIGTFLH